MPHGIKQDADGANRVVIPLLLQDPLQQFIANNSFDPVVFSAKAIRNKHFLL